LRYKCDPTQELNRKKKKKKRNVERDEEYAFIGRKLSNYRREEGGRRLIVEREGGLNREHAAVGAVLAKYLIFC
jgi:hypothetical protein